MSVLPVGIGSSGSGYQIDNSLRFRASASASLSRTFASGNRTTWTWSGWVKRGTLSTAQTLLSAWSGTVGADDGTGAFLINTSNQLSWDAYTFNRLLTTPLFRDPSAHYHIMLVWDSNNATADDRQKIYVNGVQITAFSVRNNPASGGLTGINATYAHYIGRSSVSATNYLDGYLSEIHFIDGQALTPSSFGETNADGVWVPKKYTGTYGTNGFYLDFKDGTSATTLGYDAAGSNNWTPSGISTTAGVTYDHMVDTPTNNYATLNPLDWKTTSFPLTNGNLTWTTTTTASGTTLGSHFIRSGQWYWEVTATSVGAGSCGVGIATGASVGFAVGQVLYTANTGQKYIDGVNTTYGATWVSSDVIGVAYDADAGSITFYKQTSGTGSFVSQGSFSPAGYAGVEVSPAVVDGSSLAFTLNANFGQRPFANTSVPTGFKALSTANLP